MREITPKDIAELLTGADNDYCEDLDGWPGLSTEGAVVCITFEPARETDWGAEADRENPVHFRAVVVEGDQTPIVLPRPAELGISWEDGGDLLALTKDGICLYPRGIDEWGMDSTQARELAAQLAEMADAHDAAQAGGAV